MTTAVLVAIDWGTSNRRAYLLSDNGKILETRKDHLGILNVKNGAFDVAFDRLVGDWLVPSNNTMPVLMSGMVGSRQGWVEASYVYCPAAIDDLTSNLVSVPGMKNVWIVPGICLEPNGERRDVMRGEEVQVFGGLAITSGSSGTLCLPGTHSKWIKARKSQLVDFATAMTGEVFHVMCNHSILGALMEKDSYMHHESAFARGIDSARQPGGLLNHMFTLRADGLFGVTMEDQQKSYLSGLLIGHEITGMEERGFAGSSEVFVIGAGYLTKIYGEAFEHLGYPYCVIDGEEATVRGLFAVWKASSGEKR